MEELTQQIPMINAFVLASMATLVEARIKFFGVASTVSEGENYRSKAGRRMFSVVAMERCDAWSRSLRSATELQFIQDRLAELEERAITPLDGAAAGTSHQNRNVRNGVSNRAKRYKVRWDNEVRTMFVGTQLAYCELKIVGLSDLFRSWPV